MEKDRKINDLEVKKQSLQSFSLKNMLINAKRELERLGSTDAKMQLEMNGLLKDLREKNEMANDLKVILK